MRVILAAGGTGGHVIPALAIAQELRTRFDAEIMFIGTDRGIENRLVPAAGYVLRKIDVGALKQVSVATRLKTLFHLPRAIFCAHAILAEFRPEVVIGVGGYASGPVMMAAALSSIPTLAFEPNVVPGLANRIVGTMVSAAAVQFAETCRYFRRCRVTGVPVRREFCNMAGERGINPQRHPAYGQGRPTLLVFGGSQGARPLNQVVLASLERLRTELPELHLVHQTGERDYQGSQVAYLHASVSAEIYPFIDDMPDAFRHADLLLCRSGASTVAEVMAAGKVAIFVPFPHAADNHQLRNAEALVRNGAALLIPENELTPERLVATVKSVLADPERLASMAAAAKALAHFDAAAEIARLAARLAGYLEERVATTS